MTPTKGHQFMFDSGNRSRCVSCGETVKGKDFGTIATSCEASTFRTNELLGLINTSLMALDRKLERISTALESLATLNGVKVTGDKGK